MTDDLKSIARAWAALPQVSHLRASGDGAWAFWCGSGLGEVEDVFASPLNHPGPVEQLTYGADHHQIRDVSPDGQMLILAQSRYASEHDHLLLLDRRAGNRLHLLTPKQDNHYLFGGELTRDGKAVLFVTDFDYASQRVVEEGLIWRQDLTTGKRTCLARVPHFFDQAPRQSPSGQRILLNVSERTPGSGQIWVMNADGTGLREVFVLGATNHSRGEWLDEDRIVVVTDRIGRDEVGIFSLLAGTTQWLGGEPQILPHEMVIGGKGGFACVVHKQSQTHAVVFDAAGSRPLPNMSGRRSLLPHVGLPDGGWLAEAYDADAPHEVVQVAPNGQCRRLTSVQPSQRRHRAPRDFHWTSPDGRPVQGWLYEPQGKSKGLITYVHGGPTWHSEDWVNPKIGFWVQLGYTVLDPNYRGSTGFGFDWREAVKADGWGGREQADIRAGIEAAIERGFAPRKVAVVGNSYGGFSSWYAITRFADLVTAAIPMCGMYKLDIDYHETEMPHGRAYSEEMMGGTPEDFPEKYANASPGNFIANIRGHVLIVHGLADSNVGPENTHTAERELKAAGIPHEVMLFSDEGHGVFRRTNVETYLIRSATFLEYAFAEGMR
ncbi:MAG: S9 family peptidase [Cypionkella sp.]